MGCWASLPADCSAEPRRCSSAGAKARGVLLPRCLQRGGRFGGPHRVWQGEAGAGRQVRTLLHRSPSALLKQGHWSQQRCPLPLALGLYGALFPSADALSWAYWDDPMSALPPSAYLLGSGSARCMAPSGHLFAQPPSIPPHPPLPLNPLLTLHLSCAGCGSS